MLLSNLLSVLYLIYEIREGDKIWAYESKKYDLQLYVKNSNYETKDSFYFSYPSTLFSKEDRKQFVNIGDINCSEVKDIWVDEDKGYMYGKLKYYEEYVQLKDYNIYRSNKDKKKCSGYFITARGVCPFIKERPRKIPQPFGENRKNFRCGGDFCLRRPTFPAAGKSGPSET